MQFHIQNMSCGGCVRGVTRAIQSVDPAAKVTPDLTKRTIEVASDQTRAILESALVKAGFPAGQTAA